MKTPNTIASMSLSTKLLLLTIIFVFLAEIVVLIPSVAKQRMAWLETRVEDAYLVTLALEGPREEMVDEAIIRQLFATANILGVTVNDGAMRKLIIAPEIDPHGPSRMLRVDLRNRMPTTMIAHGWATMFSKGDNYIQVTGTPRFAEDEVVNIVVSQRSLRQDLLLYARNILALSLVISSLTAALVFWALNNIIVRPVKRLTRDMTAFEQDPEQASLIHAPSDRQDEIGAAERSLAKMQGAIHQLLRQRRRLAALGSGISKISHDLRNILASAQLMSDRLAKSDDPRVRKLSPRLISALDRAIALSRDTLAFGGMEPHVLKRTKINLHELVAEVFDDTAAMGIETHNLVAEEFSFLADRTQLYRGLFNLVRNAIEAMAPPEAQTETQTENPPSDTVHGSVTITAEKEDGAVKIFIADTGPGIPDHAMAELFEPFKGSQKPGGSGLGVAISAEIVRAHGGDIVLAKSDNNGVIFEITLPMVKPKA